MTEGGPHAIVSPAMGLITLLTDFGLKDGYAGVMKGVIWGIAPHVQIADLSHLIHPQDILEGALSLGRAAPYFPAGTIHLAVVDPGVGTNRRPLAARLGEAFFVGPDNGLCSLLTAQALNLGGDVQFIHLDRPEFWLKKVSSVFHGRDIFSPVAAHLANGKHLYDLGTAIDDPVLLEIPIPEKTAGGWRGQVILVDNFGNLSTNLTGTQLSGLSHLRVSIAGELIQGLTRTFGDAPAGSLVALVGEADDLSVAVVSGSAAQMLGVGAGEPLEVLGD